VEIDFQGSVAHDEVGRPPAEDFGEAFGRQQRSNRVDFAEFDEEVEVAVVTGLPADQGIDAPAAFEPGSNTRVSSMRMMDTASSAGISVSFAIQASMSSRNSELGTRNSELGTRNSLPPLTRLLP
jgi:hypothetical protein